MAKARLLQAVCTVAILAAAPAFAFAQTDTRPAASGAGNSMNAPATDGMPEPGGGGSTSQPSTMAPASRMGTSSRSSDAMSQQSTDRSAMSGHSGRMMHSREDTSQDAAVDRLNNESLQAAQQGQSFSASNMGQGGMAAPSGSGSMNGMSGGPTPGTPATGSAPYTVGK